MFKGYLLFFSDIIYWLASKDAPIPTGAMLDPFIGRQRALGDVGNTQEVMCQIFP